MAMGHQGQGQGGYGVGGGSQHNRVSNCEYKPSQGTYSKISERSVSSLGQQFSKGSHVETHVEVENASPQATSANRQMAPAQAASDSPKVLDSYAGKSDLQYVDEYHTEERRRPHQHSASAQGANVFKTPSSTQMESTSSRPEDGNGDSKRYLPQRAPIVAGILADRQVQIGGDDIGTIKLQKECRASLDLQSDGTRQSQFMGQETHKRLFLHEVQSSQESRQLKYLNYQRKEDVPRVEHNDKETGGLTGPASKNGPSLRQSQGTKTAKGSSRGSQRRKSLSK